MVIFSIFRENEYAKDILFIFKSASVIGNLNRFWLPGLFWFIRFVLSWSKALKIIWLSNLLNMNASDEGYYVWCALNWISTEGYYRNVWCALNWISTEGYYRNMWCALNWISTEGYYRNV
jgi:hypothetical protein